MRFYFQKYYFVKFVPFYYFFLLYEQFANFEGEPYYIWTIPYLPYKTLSSISLYAY